MAYNISAEVSLAATISLAHFTSRTLRKLCRPVSHFFAIGHEILQGPSRREARRNENYASNSSSCSPSVLESPGGSEGPSGDSDPSLDTPEFDQVGRRVAERLRFLGPEDRVHRRGPARRALKIARPIATNAPRDSLSKRFGGRAAMLAEHIWTGDPARPRRPLVHPGKAQDLLGQAVLARMAKSEP